MPAMKSLVGLVLACSATCTSAAVLRANANPIRKVVNMLQSMQKKVQAEGEKEKELYEKFMCYCKNGKSDLTNSIAAAETKLGELSTDIEEAEAKLAKTTADLKKAKEDRAAGEKAMAEATGIREKEAAAFAKFSADSGANVAAISKAVTAIEAGMAGGFLQTSAASQLRKLMSKVTDDDDRQALTSFLSGGNSYAPQSGQITGILKQMHDEMAAGLAEAQATEKAAIQAYDELMAARLKEKEALTAAIQTKLTKQGELSVSIAEMKNDAGDTTEALAADKKFLAELETGCATKAKEWEARSKTRSEELLALADTIKILNDDDALELFKKTLPSASASFMQVKVSTAALRSKALETIQRVARQVRPRGNVGMDLIAMALHGKKIGFGKVITMIDEMIATLKKEQADDDSKKAYCAEQLDQADDDKKSLTRDIGQLKASIEAGQGAIATLEEEIAALTQGIKDLDASVAEATANRKAEHEEYNELIASDSAAKEILGLAKNRLQKFYNPKLYKTTTTTTAPMFVQNKADPGPPPETFGAYATKSEESGGVLQMVDLLVADLDKEMTEAEAEEKDAQADYEQLMTDSADKRSADSKSLSEKEGAKADTEAAVEGHQDDEASAQKELGATNKLISTLHAECDWLTKYYDVRKEARADETDSLSNAKAVLSGADYS